MTDLADAITIPALFAPQSRISYIEGLVRLDFFDGTEQDPIHVSSVILSVPAITRFMFALQSVMEHANGKEQGKGQGAVN